MFTGIVQQTCVVSAIESKADAMSFAVTFSPALLEGLEIGASVAIDGCCQTVRSIDAHEVWFDAIVETLRVTTLGNLQPGTQVNVERAARYGQEVGGHELSGHIDCTTDVLQIADSGDNHILTLQLPPQFERYIFNKGYLAIHGCSLTVGHIDKQAGTFQVFLIPETLRVTNLSALVSGGKVNIEIERKTQTIVDTVVAYLEEHPLGR